MREDENEVWETEAHSEVRIVNLTLCVGIVGSLLLGLLCIVSHEELVDLESTVFLFILFYMSVEVGSAAVIAGAFCCLLLGSCLSNRPVDSTDLLGMYVVCTYNLTYLAHILAIPLGIIVLFHDAESPLVYKVFIVYQVVFGCLVLGRIVYLLHSAKSSASFYPEANELAENRTKPPTGPSERKLQAPKPAPFLVDTPSAPLDSLNL